MKEYNYIAVLDYIHRYAQWPLILSHSLSHIDRYKRVPIISANSSSRLSYHNILIMNLIFSIFLLTKTFYRTLLLPY